MAKRSITLSASPAPVPTPEERAEEDRRHEEARRQPVRLTDAQRLEIHQLLRQLRADGQRMAQVLDSIEATLAGRTIAEALQ